jgi:late competence protein required for DNA uptake (superfamily II DNA/RNA helicase)
MCLCGGSEPAWKVELQELRERVSQLTQLVAGVLAAKKGRRQCYRCGSRDHLRRQCAKSGRACYRCGEVGHLRRGCPRKVAVKLSDVGNGIPPQ